MLLKEILNQVLREQDEGNMTIEFPKEKFVVSVDKQQKKLIFSPQESSALANKIRPTILLLKRNFNVANIRGDEGEADIEDPNARGIFEVELDPRENIDKVIEFLSRQVGG